MSCLIRDVTVRDGVDQPDRGGAYVTSAEALKCATAVGGAVHREPRMRDAMRIAAE